MKVVLLAGGKGTRISEESQFRPKPMVEVEGMPILWHIMKYYSFYGFNEFIICAGYKQEYIKEWFSNYLLRNCDVTFDFLTKTRNIVHSSIEPWKVTVVNTGSETMTGGRILRVKSLIGNEPFLMTYGDAVCDVDILDTVNFHKSHGKLATITSVIQRQQKGILDISDVGAVKSFREKQVIDGYPINAGYMVLQPEIFDLLSSDTDVFENVVLERLSDQGELMSYMHKGFWQCMDSLREKVVLDTLVKRGCAPWIKWSEE